MATQTMSANHLPAPALRPFPNDTLTKLFFSAIDSHPRPDAMQYRHDGEWRPISHREVESRVMDLAAALTKLGVARGDRVALLSENRPEWAITDYAVLGLGAVHVPIYPTLPPGQIAYILNDCQARVVLVSTPEQLAKIQEVRAQVPELKHVISFDDPQGADGVRRLDAVLAEGRQARERGEVPPFREQALTVQPEDLATLIYTSGTTGNPKGVMLTHLNIASNVAAVRQHGVIRIEPGEVALSFLPLCHSFERTADYFYWECGASIAYVDAVDKVAQSLLEVRPHVFAAAPRVFEKIYTKVMGATGIKKKLVMWAKGVGEATVDERLSGRRPGPEGFSEKLADRLVFSKLRARTGGRVRMMISGSAPLSGDIAKFFWAAGLPIFEGYGLTETSPVLTANKPGAVKLGSVGQPIPGTELRIGDQGEILARGPQVMKGYWNQEAETTAVIDSEGWIHTGDVGEIDPQGFLRITDRIKNLLVTAGGKNIAPQPIENAAAMSPFVSQVLMLGDKRAFPTLLVVPDFDNLTAWAKQQGIDTSERERLARDPRVVEMLEKETIGRLDGFARYETPKKIAVIPHEFGVDTGELTPTLKVKRRVVEERYRDTIEQLYEG